MRKGAAFIPRAASLAPLYAADEPAVPPQGRCYCLQRANESLPYRMVRFLPTPPGCANSLFISNGVELEHTGLGPCDALQTCEKDRRKHYPELKLIEDKTEKAMAQRNTCCKDGDKIVITGLACRNQCSSDWDKVLKDLSEEKNRLLKAIQDEWDRCFRKNVKFKPMPARSKRTGLPRIESRQ